MDEPRTARQMFLKYSGSHFHMIREGVYEEYQRFKVSKEQEQQWAMEREQQLLTQLRNTEEPTEITDIILALARWVMQCKELGVLPRILSEIDRPGMVLDSLSQVIIAETLLNLVKSLAPTATKDNALTNVKMVASRLLRSVIENPITISPHYSDGPPLVNPSDEALRLRAARNLERLSSGRP